MVEPLFRKRSPPLFPASPRAELRGWFHSLSILSWHYVYLFVLFFSTSLILWGSDTRGKAERINYLDSLFLAISSGTGTGLNNVLLSGLNTFQQIVCYLLILSGSHIFVAAVIINYHRICYKRKYVTSYPNQEHVRQQWEENSARTSTDSTRFASSDREGQQNSVLLDPLQAHQLNAQFAHELEVEELGQRKCDGMPSLVANRNEKIQNVKDPPSGKVVLREPTEEFQAVAASSKENCAVYHALSILSILLPLYFFIFQFLGSVILAVRVSGTDILAMNDLNPTWFSTFNAVSAFQNSGLSLLDANMAPFSQDWLVLVVMSVLILAGNTCYPVFLKVMIWCLARAVKAEHGEAEDWKRKWKAGLEVLEGDGARRLLPWLLGSKETLWLAASVVILSIIDWVCTIASIEEGFPEMPGVSAGNRILSALFQAFAVRSGGFAVVSISELRTWLLVIYSFMMYTAAFPIFVAPVPLSPIITSTSTYPMETPAKGDEEAPKPLPPSTTVSNIDFLRAQVHFIFRYPAPDFIYLSLVICALTISEANNIQADPVGFSVMNLIFEVTSAYGCVGVSVGGSGRDTAFSAAWTKMGKLFLCVVMLAGRIRELRAGVAEGWKGY